MHKRTLAREVALKGLYQYDIHREVASTAAEELDSFLAERAEDPEVLRFARDLLSGAIARLEELDARIASASQHWKINRIATVDRCVLRLAILELLESPDTPPKVAINEAIELAKKYSTEASGAFVNGVLDAIWRDLARERESAELRERQKEG